MSHFHDSLIVRCSHKTVSTDHNFTTLQMSLNRRGQCPQTTTLQLYRCPMGVALYGSPRTALVPWVLLCTEVPGLPLPHGCCSVRKSQDCPCPMGVALCGSPRIVPWVLLCAAVPGLPLPHLLICATVPALPHMCCPVRQPQSHQSSAWLWLIHRCHDKITR